MSGELKAFFVKSFRRREGVQRTDLATLQEARDEAAAIKSRGGTLEITIMQHDGTRDRVFQQVR